MCSTDEGSDFEFPKFGKCQRRGCTQWGPFSPGLVPRNGSKWFWNWRFEKILYFSSVFCQRYELHMLYFYLISRVVCSKNSDQIAFKFFKNSSRIPLLSEPLIKFRPDEWGLTICTHFHFHSFSSWYFSTFPVGIFSEVRDSTRKSAFSPKNPSAICETYNKFHK